MSRTHPAQASTVGDGVVFHRGLTIGFLLDGRSHEFAAAMNGMTRRTSRDWVHRFNGAGVVGLCDAFGESDQEMDVPPWPGPFFAVSGGRFQRKSQRKWSHKSRDVFPIHPAPAPIDIGTTIHVAAVGPDRDKEPVWPFQPFTDDLHRLTDWFSRRGIQMAVMESTGIYRIPVSSSLKQRAFEVMAVNARDTKRIPGRDTDVNDAQWLRRLHEYRLPRASWITSSGMPGG